MAINKVFGAPLRALVPPAGGAMVLEGLITGNGTSDPTTGEGSFLRGMSATRDALGVYTITLPGNGTVDVSCAVFTVESAAGVRVAGITARDDTARTIEVTIQDTATPTNDDLETTDSLHFFIVVNQR